MKPPFLALVIAGLFLSASLCFARQVSKPDKSARNRLPDYSELTEAPEKARLRPNPFEKDPDALVAGQFLFENHCSECHGDAGVGGKKAPSLRAPEVQDASPGTLFWLLTSGVTRKGMPVWSKLPEAQRWQIVRYLKSLGTKSESSSDKLRAPGKRLPRSDVEILLRRPFFDSLTNPAPVASNSTDRPTAMPDRFSATTPVKMPSTTAIGFRLVGPC